MGQSTLTTWIQRGLILLVALMPFHAFLSVWAGHLFGHQAIWQGWKEVLISVLAIAAVALLIREPQRRKRLHQPAIYLAAAFTVVALVVTAIIHPELKAVVYGLKFDLEFLVAFVIALLVGEQHFNRQLLKTVLISSGVVIAFGLLQIYILPPDWLVHFGYGPTTIEPYLQVDPAIQAFRIIGTLGGPNQLGSFLILPLAIVTWQLITKPRWWQAVYVVAGGIVLWHSYARAAQIGLILAVAVLLMLRTTRRWRLPLLLGTTIVAAIALQIITGPLVSNRTLQYYLFHQQLGVPGEHSSTDQHLGAYKLGIDTAENHPLGLGIGAAGPASFQSSTGRIPENYYLQLAIETGILGLLLFCAFEISVGIGLWKRAHLTPLAAGGVAALAGIAVVNLFLHGWTDSSTALIFWTTAGAVLGTRRS